MIAKKQIITRANISKFDKITFKFKIIDKTKPRADIEDIPRIEGSTSGFFNKFCKIKPEIDNDIPVMKIIISL